MSGPSPELDRLMRQRPTPLFEARAHFARLKEQQRRDTQARLRAKRGELVFSTES